MYRARILSPPLNYQPLFPLQLLLRDPKSHLQHIHFLFQVRPLQSRGHTSTRISPSIHDMFPIVVLSVIQQGLNPRLREAPRAGVQRLLLSPDDGLGIGIHVEVLLQLLPWERIELLDASYGDRVEIVLFAMFVQGDVSLARTQYDAVDLFWGRDGLVLVGWVGDDPLEVGFAAELFDGRAGERVSEERFGEEKNQGCRQI